MGYPLLMFASVLFFFFGGGGGLLKTSEPMRE